MGNLLRAVGFACAALRSTISYLQTVFVSCVVLPMETISILEAIGPPHLILAVLATALTVSVLVPAHVVARPFEGLIKAGAGLSRDELSRLRKHYFHLFRVRGLTQKNASQALMLAGALWVLLRAWSYIGGSAFVWLMAVALLVLAVSVWAWQHVGPRATPRRFVSVFYLPVVFLVLYPHMARQAERLLDGTASYASLVAWPVKAPESGERPKSAGSGI